MKKCDKTSIPACLCDCDIRVRTTDREQSVTLRLVSVVSACEPYYSNLRCKAFFHEELDVSFDLGLSAGCVSGALFILQVYCSFEQRKTTEP